MIAPPSGWGLPSFRELWHSRDVVYFLARRDVAVRYKQTAIGALWAVLQPVGLAVVFSVFLGALARVESHGVPYPVFALTGMTMWLFFTNAVSLSAESMVSSAHLLSKVYFPRIAIPVASLAPPLVDLTVSFSVLMVALFLFGVTPEAQILLAPLVLLLACAVAFGAGLWLSALAVRYRDIRYVVPFGILVFLFVTPVVYPLSEVSEAVRPFYSLNPMVGVLEAFRWAVLPGMPGPGPILLVPVATSCLLILSGLLYFKRAEREFADIV